MIPETLKPLAVSIDSLRPYERNPRNGDLEAIKVSLETNAQYRPIVVNARDNRILAGNHTYAAAIELGWKEIAATFVDVDEEQAARIVLVDNRTNDLAWNDDALIVEILNELPDLEGTGYTDESLEELLAGIEQRESEGLTDPDAIPEVPEEPITKRGDVWLLGRHRVMCGDAVAMTDVDTLMAGEQADMVYTDPPYGVDIVKGGWVGGGAAYNIPFGGVKNRGSDGASKPFGSKGKRGTDGATNMVKVGIYDAVIGDESTQTAVDAYNLCAGLGVKVLVFWGGNYYASSLPDSAGWIVWDKENTGNFADAELAWTNQNRAVRIFKHQWNGMLRASERGEKRVHPTQKPVALAEWTLENYGKDEDRVLDLFAGSGGTLTACERSGRTGYMMELSEQYVDVICRRFQEYTGTLPVLESTGKERDFVNTSNT